MTAAGSPAGWIRLAGVLLVVDGLILGWIGLLFLAALVYFGPVSAIGPRLTDWLLALAFTGAGLLAIVAGVQCIRLRRSGRAAGLLVAGGSIVLILSPLLVGGGLQASEIGMLAAALGMQAAIAVPLLSWRA
jgi:hypothetical protein